MGNKMREKLRIKVVLYYRKKKKKKMQYKAETSKYEPIFPKRLLFRLVGLQGKVELHEKEEEVEEERGGVKEVPARLHKSFQPEYTGGQFTHYPSVGCKYPKASL